jgi:hypothetical protein
MVKKELIIFEIFFTENEFMKTKQEFVKNILSQVGARKFSIQN